MSGNHTDGCDALIADKIDLLFEKRKAIREAALSALYKILSLRYCGASLESRQETLAEALERVLRDQQDEPMLLALRTAATAAISLPTGHHALFARLRDSIRRIILDETKPITAKTEAINALAMTCFMSSLFDVDHELSATSDILALFREMLFSKTTLIPTDIAIAVLQGWLLLASTLPASTVHDEIYSKYLDNIGSFMNEDFDIPLRVTAARAVSILVESEKDYKKSASDDNPDFAPDDGEMLEKMNNIYDDKAKFKASLTKVDLKKHRSMLKALIAYIETGETEEETILIRKSPLVLSTWMQRFRMDCFRNYLGEGFMTHLEENRNLMYIFDYYVDTSVPVIPSMSKKQRRLSLSEISKAATKHRGSLRAIREQETGYATE